MPQHERTPNLTIRQSTADDILRIREVNRLAWEAAYSHIYNKAEIEGLFENSIPQNGEWQTRRKERLRNLVAEQDDEIIGFVGLALLPGGEGEITHLYVHPRHQGGGVGYALWRAGIEALRRRRCKLVWVWVLAKAPAYQFYLRQGCEPRQMSSYFVGGHEEKTIGLNLTLPEFSTPQWLAEKLLTETLDWSQGQASTMPAFLNQYTLHDSYWLGLWMGRGMSEITLLLDWDTTYANWKTPRIDVPTGEVAYLLLRYSKIYHLITSDIETGQTLLDRAESRIVSEAERRLWAQLITAQTLVGNESVDYILDDALHQTSIIGLDGDIIHLFHGAALRLLCLNSDGDPLFIPDLPPQKL